ncbi:MAG: GPW/gp25 family protein [Proteobacteria bacterium]|nr:GPW/gp25 family protein [Pseudomonadota bacterium]
MALSNGRHLAFPFRIGSDGRTAAPASDAGQVRDELLQLLLTSPGERLFLPEFGGGVRKLVFEPASDVLRGVVKARITQALSNWLGHRLTVEMIDVRFGDEPAVSGETPELLLDPLTGGIEVTVKYRPAGSPDSRIVKFQRTGQ